MTQQKLYTEEQVRIAMSEARYAFTTKKSYDEIVQSLKPIELPSDEEINEFLPYVPQDASIDFWENKEGFIEGAKWLRDKILNK